MRAARKGRWLALALLLSLTGLVLGGTTATAAPGNNGTIKIDGIAFDDHPNNEPHPTCTFQVDFYGYEQGDLFAKTKFWAIPPTGKRILLLEDEGIFIGEDAAGGGTDLDAAREYDLSFALEEFMAHVNQGYHIKLRVNAPHSIGKDTKFKAFWVTGCSGY